MPLGSLDEHGDISYKETVSVLNQCLLALDYLHGREKPIAHRDIKRETFSFNSVISRDGIKGRL